MIVEAMTMEEIRNELKKDFPIVFRKANYVSIAERKTLKLDRGTECHGFYEYYSKYKNHWIYRIVYTKKETFFSFLNYNNDSRGLNAIVTTGDMDDTLFFLNGHFFKRYNERRKLGLTTTFDILSAFLEETTAFDPVVVSDLGNNLNEVFCTGKSGVLLGVENTVTNTIRINTFISNDMLKTNQQELAKQRRDEMLLDTEFFNYFSP